MEYVLKFDEHEEYQNYKDGPFYLGPNVSMCMDMIHTHISGEQQGEANYLTFTALENSTIRLNFFYNPSLMLEFQQFLDSIGIEYATSITKGWENYFSTGGTADAENTHIWHGKEITLQKGDVVKFRGQNNKLSDDSTYFFFSMTGSIDASGDVTSLNNRIGGDISMPSYNFINLFQNCTALKTAPSLPSTSLNPYCYKNMFGGCTSLTKAPELPATTLASNCYQGMFSACTSLTTAPSLPSTTLADYCYQHMFSNCASLTTAPALPATNLAYSCYQSMFRGCTSLTTAPSILPATTLASNCYQYMFMGCTALKTVPALPATTLASYCYYYMFQGCTSLTTAPALPATTLASRCYTSMFQGCTSLTTAPSLPATAMTEYCYAGMFQDCTSLTSAPDLLATKLEKYCYSQMFMGCTSLTSPYHEFIRLPAETLKEGCYQYMFDETKVSYVSIEATSINVVNCCKYMFYRVKSNLYIRIRFTSFYNSYGRLNTDYNCPTFCWIEGIYSNYDTTINYMDSGTFDTSSFITRTTSNIGFGSFTTG